MRYLLFLILLHLVVGCENCNDDCPGAGGNFRFVLNDAQTRSNLFFGENSLYDPDDLIISGHLAPRYEGDKDTSFSSVPRVIQHDVKGVHMITYLGELTNENYFNLPNGEVDTLLYSITEAGEDECCKSYQLANILYNGTVICNPCKSDSVYEIYK